MYGSNFWIVTLRPRSTSRRPSDAAAMPFPREETTPPVTKMYFVELTDSPLSGVGPAPLRRTAGLPACLLRVQQRPQLLEPLPALFGHDGEAHPPRERVPRVCVDAHVLVAGDVSGAIAVERDRRPGEVHRAPRGAH